MCHDADDDFEYDEMTQMIIMMTRSKFRLMNHGPVVLLFDAAAAGVALVLPAAAMTLPSTPNFKL